MVSSGDVRHAKKRWIRNTEVGVMLPLKNTMESIRETFLEGKSFLGKE